jgi:diketogulonate reductase-like aldo/keto reductase
MTAGAVTADGRGIELADGKQLPMLGLGVWQVPDGPTCVNAVRWALELGYRHIDTAQAYGNEESVGQGLRDSGVPRDEVFITTKFYPGRRDPVAEAEGSLRRLGVDHVDLYLVHWPQGGPLRAWPGMEQARERGLATSIGVSNFSVTDLGEVIAAGSVPPAVNQVDFNAMHYRRGLLDACLRAGVVLEAYSPLGTGRYLSNRRVTAIAARAGRTPAQVLLRWCLQHGVPVIPKSTHRERIAENAEIFDFILSAQDMAELDALDQTHGTDRARLSGRGRWWPGGEPPGHHRRDEIVGDLFALVEHPGQHRPVQQRVLLRRHLNAGGLQQVVERGQAVRRQPGERLGAVRVGIRLGGDREDSGPPRRVAQARAQAGQPGRGHRPRIGSRLRVTAVVPLEDHVDKQRGPGRPVPVQGLPRDPGPLGEQRVGQPRGPGRGQQFPGRGQDVVAGALDARVAGIRGPVGHHPIIQVV